VDKLPKAQAVRYDDHTVRSVWSIPLEVVREDDQYWYYKVYRPPEVAPPPIHTAPTAAELEAIEASYQVHIPTGRPLAFRDFGQGLPSAGQWRDGFAIADMNGDGHLDIVHGPARKSMGYPAVFLGDGAGHWSRWKGLEFPPLAYDYGDVQVADLDGDGQLDLVLAVHLHGLIALLGDGKGHFKDGGKGLDFSPPGPPGFSSRAIALLDWNHDGRTDILALGEGPRLMPGSAGGGNVLDGGSAGAVLYLNHGALGWERKDQGTGARENFGSSLALGDFDGDGRLDFAEGSGFLGRQDIVHLAQADGSWRAESVPALRPMSYVNSVAARDLDGDGRAELAVGYQSFEGSVWRSGVDLFHRSAAGVWTRTALAVERTTVGVVSLAFGDVDGDAVPDLAALTGDGAVWLFRGLGAGAFERVSQAIPPHPDRCRGARVEIADLTGDGQGEVIASFADEHDSDPSGTDRQCPTQGGIRAWKLDAAGAR